MPAGLTCTKACKARCLASLVPVMDTRVENGQIHSGQHTILQMNLSVRGTNERQQMSDQIKIQFPR